MDSHALAVLTAVESWDWPILLETQQSCGQLEAGKYRALTMKFLSCCIRESGAYPDSTLLETFWKNVRECHTGFRTNSEIVAFV
jgi:hypothetical protein